MKYVIVIYSNDPENVWNAFRLANMCLAHDEDVTVFLLGQGVESSSIKSMKFDIEEQMQNFEDHGGKLIGCTVCCDIRKYIMPELEHDLRCTMGSMMDLYGLIKEGDKIITF
ncbi:MAG: DsrE family protein [Gammaproteobacteria bacterium]|nr:DsrE family protein [Gammaproteobacteria bacterium]MDH5735403.1 DsrE family protein [Gammaproteobacteria bacterium]